MAHISELHHPSLRSLATVSASQSIVIFQDITTAFNQFLLNDSNFEVSITSHTVTYLFKCSSLPNYAYLIKYMIDLANQKINHQLIFISHSELMTIVMKPLRLSLLHKIVRFGLNEYSTSINPENGEIKIAFAYQVNLSDKGIRMSLLNSLYFQYERLREMAQKCVSMFIKIQDWNGQVSQADLNKDHTLMKYLTSSFAQFGISNDSLQEFKRVNHIDTLKIENFLQFSLDSRQFQSQYLYSNHQQVIPSFIITQKELKSFENFLQFPTPKMIHNNENSYIFNQISIKNIDTLQLKETPIKGSFSTFSIAKIKFEYLPTFEANQSYLEKIVLIKFPTVTCKQWKIEKQKRILKRFNTSFSAYLPKYYESKSRKFKQGLLMDYFYEQPNLQTFIHQHSLSLSFHSKIYILNQLANGLRFLKRHRVVHMDLSTSNIIIFRNNLPKIIDFGESCHDSDSDQQYQPGYTLPFCPPECFTQTKFTSKSDIFSWGIIMFYLLFNRFPFEATQKLKQSYKHRNYPSKFFFAPESLLYYQQYKLGMYMISLLNRCFSEKVEDRPYVTWCRIILKILVNNFLLGQDQ